MTKMKLVGGNMVRIMRATIALVITALFIVACGKATTAKVSAEGQALQSAFQYNLLANGDIKLGESKVQGRVATTGNASLRNYSIGESLPNDSTRCDLSVAGSLQFTKGSVYQGAICVLGVLSKSDVGAGTTARKAIPENLTGLIVGAKAAAKAFAAFPAMQVVDEKTMAESAPIIFTGRSSSLNVFQTSAATLALATRIDVVVPTGATALINVSGIQVSFSSLSVNADSSRLLFNFYEAQRLSMRGLNGKGSILAPLATTSFLDGAIDGNLVVGGITGNGRINYVPFVGVL
jgi:choice-of-anchor A domain-containing protein